MKKKNLIILLIIPFVIALLGIVAINATFNVFYGDLSGIDWNYDDVEGFMVSDTLYKLEAKGYASESTRLAPGNSLIWTIENKNSSDVEKYAEIVESSGSYYLKAIKPGDTILTVSNQKGNVFRRMEAIIYSDGLITLTPHIKSSQNNIDSSIYYGKYDFDENGSKVEANILFDFKVLPESVLPDVKVLSKTDNLNVNLSQDGISVKIISNSNIEDSYFTVGVDGFSSIKERSYNFKVVDGVNCYTYDDLLRCTNKSVNGETVVLRKNFESENYVSRINSNNTCLFGNKKNNEYNFDSDVYRYETNYNHEYINQWNEFAKNNSYNPISREVIAGLHLKKNLYGNGYTINFHNLCYPKGVIDIDGVKKPSLLQTDLFRGPLKYYTLGDPNNMPLVSAYGEDNCGIYVDRDNVLINDLNVKNCDTPTSLEFLEFTGNVINVEANNVTISNSRLQNAKNIIRAFSSKNVTIKNSLLQTSMNFLITTGANEYIKPSDESFLFETLDGNISISPKDYLKKGGAGDEIMNQYISGNFDNKEKMQKALNSIQKGLSNSSVKNEFKGTMEVVDTYFYNSGLACIAFESLFNGPFLYSNSPSLIGDLFGELDGASSLIPFFPNEIAGASYPVSVNISGHTRFYDYKEPENINLSGLIEENISKYVKELTQKDTNVDIDTIFPLKSTLLSQANGQSCIYKYQDKQYINIPVCFYGGGENESVLTFSDDFDSDFQSKTLNVDFAKNYLSFEGIDMEHISMQSAIGAVKKCVVVSTGFEPFKFVCMSNTGYLFGQTPNIKDLINNA